MTRLHPTLVAPVRRLSCPICGKPAQAPTRPFCSERCADIDLGRWFGERYKVPAEAPARAPGTDSKTPAEEGGG